MHHTHGEGYYEQEKLGEELSNYGLENVDFGDTIIKITDLIAENGLIMTLAD